MKSLFFYELSTNLTEINASVADENTDPPLVVSFRYFLCDKTGQLIEQGQILNSDNLSHVQTLAMNAQCYFIFSAMRLSVKQLSIPGKLNSAIIDSLKYQVENDIASDVAFMNTHLLNKQGETITFALIDNRYIKEILDYFDEVGIVLKGIYPDSFLLPYDNNMTTAYFDTDNQTMMSRHSQFLVTVLPLEMTLQFLPELLSKEISDKVLGHDEPTHQLLERNDKSTVKYHLLTSDNQHLSVLKLKAQIESQWHDKVEIKQQSIYEIFHDGLIATPLKLTHHFNFLPAKYYVKRSTGLSKWSKRFLSIISLVIMTSLFYQGLSIWQEAQLLSDKEKALINYYNQKASTKFKTTGQISADIKSRLKNSSNSHSVDDINIFTWYAKLPTIFTDAQMQISQMRFDKSKQQLRITIEVNSHQTLNKIKQNAATLFNIIDAPVTQRGETIETVLILELKQ